MKPFRSARAAGAASDYRIFSGARAVSAVSYLAVALAYICPLAPLRAAGSGQPPAPRSARSDRAAKPAGKKSLGGPVSATAPVGSGIAVPSAEKPFPEVADAFPSPYQPAPADLLLKKEEAKKADAFSYFIAGFLAERDADQETTLQSFRRTLELDPSNTELAVKVALDLARDNRPSEGIQILKDALKASPRNPLPAICLSQIYFKSLKKPGLALQYAQQAFNISPENIGAIRAVYDLYVADRQNQKAVALLEKAEKSTQDDADYWRQVGELYARIYLKDDAATDPAQIEKMNAIYRKAAALGSKDAGVLTAVGDYFVLSKQVKEAIPFYLAVLGLKTDDDDPPVSSVREKLAQIFMLTGEREQAIKCLEEIVSHNPVRFEPYEMLGELYEELDDLPKALANYEHSLVLDTTKPANHLRFAQLLLRTKNYDRAIDVLQAARKKFSDLPSITYYLAIALSQAKRHPEAMAAFSDAQAEAGSIREEMLDGDFFFNYGAAAEQAGLYDQATALLKKSLGLNPDSAQTCNYLGYMWADRGENLDEAGELIKKAVATEPDKGEYLDSLGWYFFKKGDTDRALKELLHAQESILRDEKKDDPTVLEHIGDVYGKIGRMTDAMAYWQRSLALDKDNKKVAEKIDSAKQKMTAVAPLAPPAQASH